MLIDQVGGMKVHLGKASKVNLLVLEKKQPLVRQSIASAYEARRLPYFLERATTRVASATTEMSPMNSLTA